MPDSVHDNWLYAQSIDHGGCRIVLRTIYPHVEPAEYTDVVFEGVVVRRSRDLAEVGTRANASPWLLPRTQPHSRAVTSRGRISLKTLLGSTTRR